MTASGAPAGFEERKASPAPAIPAGLNDMLSPISSYPGAGSTAVIPDARDLAAPGEAEPEKAVSCWAHLAAIALDLRGAVVIEIEPLAAVAARDLETVRAVEALWKDGRSAEAIDALRRLEEAGVCVAAGVSWSGGAGPAALREGEDVRIGTRTNAWGVDVDELRIRRCSVATGLVDATYGYKVAIDAGSETFADIVVASNADDYDNRIYCLGIQSDHVLRHAWAASDGQTFYDITPPATANARHGLSGTWEAGDACDEYLYVSYAGTDGGVHMLGRSAAAWTELFVEPDVGMGARTSISAYDGNVICAFEYPYPEGIGIFYEISCNCGSTWNWADIAEPDGTTTFSFWNPSVDARNGLGAAVVYQAEMGLFDPMCYRSRLHYAPGPWENPMTFNEFDVLTGGDTVLNPLSPRGGTAYDLGAMYIDRLRIPYFDQPARTFSAVPEAPASAPSLRLLPASPNPSREQTAIRFELPAPGRARLELFDLLGRRVATLLDEEIEAGAHEVPLASRGLKTGLYVYRLTTGSDEGGGRLIVIP